jgi:predicted ATP-grasp superfamily ATP-dependent carboligase
MSMDGWTPARLSQSRTTILVHEWVTGGGLAGRPLPPSWAAEGHSMRRAIARDFASLAEARVLVTLDERFPEEEGPWSTHRVGPGEEEATFSRLATAHDYTVLIAPETGGVLADRSRIIERSGRPNLGSDSAAVALTGDKLRLGRHLAEHGVVTPPCRRVVPQRGLPLDFPYPAVLKPIDGAGAQDTFLIPAAGDFPQEALALPVALLQPLVPGAALSASFLVGRDGSARLIAAGEQHVTLRDGRFAYRGGRVPVVPHGAGEARRAVESVRGLRGFVGVDYLWEGESGSATVLEINPRPTTSYVGLAHGLPAGTLARAWLELALGIAPRPSGALMFAEPDIKNSVSFTADGGMIESTEGQRP